ERWRLHCLVQPPVRPARVSRKLLYRLAPCHLCSLFHNLTAMKRPVPALLFVALLLCGCESAVPSEADGRAVVEGQAAGGGGFSGSALRLADFRKVNGQEQEFGGVRVYEM